MRAINIIITTITPIIQLKSMFAAPADLRVVTVLLRVVTVLYPLLQHPESPWAQPPPTCASLNLCARRYSTRRYPHSTRRSYDSSQPRETQVPVQHHTVPAR